MSPEPSDIRPGKRARRGPFAPFRLFFALTLLLSAFGGTFGALTPGAAAATTTFNVNSTDDTINPGACALATADQCTLREAIIEANALAAATPNDTFVINLVANATYDLTNYNVPNTPEDAAATGDLDIRANLTINGNGATVDGEGDAVSTDQQDRVFQVFRGYTVVMNTLTITDGYAYHSNGGGILHDGADATNGSLTLNGVTVTGNDTGFVNNQDNPGAGIYNGVGLTLTLNNSTVNNNGHATTSNPGDGGGIYNEGTLTLANNSVVTGNLGGLGGGIYNAGTLSVTSSTVSSNTAQSTYNGTFYSGGDGGGIYNLGTSTLTSGTVSNNTANFASNNNSSSGGSGGGVYNAGALTLANNSAGTGNSASLGSGIFNLGELSLTNSTISNNTSSINANNGPFGSGGGGIFNAGSAVIATSNISGNSAIIGGGIVNSAATGTPARSGAAAAQVAPGTLMLSNTIVSANTASLFGGGIFNATMALTITGGALSNNTATGVILLIPGLGSLEFGGQGGALTNLDTTTLTNTTINNNSASTLNGNQSTNGPPSNGNGGGVANAGVLNVSGTTFSGNSVAGPGTGGALFNGPKILGGMAVKAGVKPGAQAASINTVATLSNSTLSGNVTTNGGAAVLNDDNSTVSLFNVTVANNQSGLLNQTGAPIRPG